ncbi:MAG: hypothetical protein IPK24_04555 [Kineosporiaceae bacterium]|nr:hypothetical protein [Kineosporiaceae bacterium]MBK8074842.1 hypothetical protein [Kineosporiaceae bacterium]
MMFRLRRDESLLGEALSECARHLAAAAHHLAAALDSDPEARTAAVRRLQETDRNAEDAAHAVLRGLAASFVTPFDRADIFRLSWAMRRAAARTDAVGDTFEVLRLGDLPPRTAELVQLVVRATEIIAAAVPRLGDPGNLATPWVDLTVLVKQAGQLHRRLLLDITTTISEPTLLMRHVEAATSLRRLIDAVDSVADALQTVVVTES